MKPNAPRPETIEDMIRRLVRDESAKLQPSHESEWVDQSSSPLGRRLHCRLVRDGELPGVCVHRRVMVKREDLVAYLERHVVKPESSTCETEKQAFDRVGARRIGGAQ